MLLPVLLFDPGEDAVCQVQSSLSLQVGVDVGLPLIVKLGVDGVDQVLEGVVSLGTFQPPFLKVAHSLNSNGEPGNFKLTAAKSGTLYFILLVT